MIAVPGQLVVVTNGAELPDGQTIDDQTPLIESTLGVVGITKLQGASFEGGGDAALLQLPSSVAVDDVLKNLPDLQGPGRSVDLNYLEPLQPNDAFRPADNPKNPTQDEVPNFGEAGAVDVLLIDSQQESDTTYDFELNGYIDEAQGHGVFVRSIIERSGANVELVGVPPDDATRRASGRWAPMTFSDWNIVMGILSASDLFPDYLNLSLGGVGCGSNADGPVAGSNPLAWGIGERLALARFMYVLWGTNASFKIVAAAGNNGSSQVLHFPAAWRNATAMSAIANAISDSGVAQQVRDMSSYLQGAMYAVGSLDDDDQVADSNDQRSDFSNFGCWVNAAAYGRDQIGEYASSAGSTYVAPTTPPNGTVAPAANVQWSGTSFATANFTAALAVNAFVADPTAIQPDTGARILSYGLGEVVAGQEGDCPETTPTTTTAP
jgi:hypothetical protein